MFYVDLCMNPGMIDLSSEAPPSFLCPVTMELMEDPVIILGSMQTVSRAAARHWFYLGNYRCPVTNVELQNCKTIPNRSLRAAIQEWQQSGGKHIKKSFLCPVTSEILKDPVVMVGSMQTVERKVAEQWLDAGNMRCPVTNVTLKNRLLVTNYAVKGALEEWESVHGKLSKRSRKGPRRNRMAKVGVECIPLFPTFLLLWPYLCYIFPIHYI